MLLSTLQQAYLSFSTASSPVLLSHTSFTSGNNKYPINIPWNWITFIPKFRIKAGSLQLKALCFSLQHKWGLCTILHPHFANDHSLGGRQNCKTQLVDYMCSRWGRNSRMRIPAWSWFWFGVPARPWLYVISRLCVFH